MKRSTAGRRSLRTPAIIHVVLLLGLFAEFGCEHARSASSSTPQTSSLSKQATPFLFRKTSNQQDVSFSYDNGDDADLCTMLESLGGGVAWFDFDRDGWPDLAAAGGGKFAADHLITGLPCGLFRSVEGESFEPVQGPSYLTSNALFTNGLSAGDFDNDGFTDLLVTGYGNPQLWHNQGDGTFLETAVAARIENPAWSSSAGWADFNSDGVLDLYVARYVNWSFENDPFCAATSKGGREICPPRSFEPLPDSVYFGVGDGTFSDTSRSAGLRLDGKGLGVLLADMEPDGDTDIYVANDTTDNFLYVNDGKGHFAEQGQERGAALDENGIPNGSMGVDLCDFNFDGKPDIWVANYERESFALYRNEGRGVFLHVSQRTGITDIGGLFVGFGTTCDDFDGDGEVDMVVANGHVIKYPIAAPRRQLPLFLSYDGQRFRRREVEPENYFGQPHEGRGLATADFDRDGDLDLAISHLHEPIALLENIGDLPSRWLEVELIGIASNRDAIGAQLEITVEGKRVVRQVTGGGSYLSQKWKNILFQLPAQTRQLNLKVRWPRGEVQLLGNIALDQRLTILEPIKTH